MFSAVLSQSIYYFIAFLILRFKKGSLLYHDKNKKKRKNHTVSLKHAVQVLIKRFF